MVEAVYTVVADVERLQREKGDKILRDRPHVHRLLAVTLLASVLIGWLSILTVAQMRSKGNENSSYEPITRYGERHRRHHPAVRQRRRLVVADPLQTVEIPHAAATASPATVIWLHGMEEDGLKWAGTLNQIR